MKLCLRLSSHLLIICLHLRIFHWWMKRGGWLAQRLRDQNESGRHGKPSGVIGTLTIKRHEKKLRSLNFPSSALLSIHPSEPFFHWDCSFSLLGIIVAAREFSLQIVFNHHHRQVVEINPCFKQLVSLPNISKGKWSQTLSLNPFPLLPFSFYLNNYQTLFAPLISSL